MSNKEPLYAELARLIVRDIQGGVLPVGSTLPTELELAERHRVSRGTVRAALRMVQDLGLLSRKRKAGTRIERAQQPGEYSPSFSTLEELVQYGEIAKRSIHSVTELVVDLELERSLGLRAGTRWMCFGTSRANPDQPKQLLCWSDVYVEAEAGRKIRKRAHHTDELFCDLVQRATGRVVVEVRQRIRAAGISAEMSQRLGARAGAHALEFTRHYLDQRGAVVAVAVAVHPADRFAYFTTLRRPR